jgi:hypothetical protein
MTPNYEEIIVTQAGFARVSDQWGEQNDGWGCFSIKQGQ